MQYLAIDLGAGSGRAIVGIIENGQIRLDEVHRFPNKPVQLGKTLYWDFLAIFENIKTGIRQAFRKGYDIEGMAVDTWGVDFGILDRKGSLISNPVCYRDTRTDGMPELVSGLISSPEMYQQTGIQQINLNTIYQLFSLKYNQEPTLSIVDKIVFIPDLINYYFTRTFSNEYTIASTSQMLNAETREWDDAIFEKLELPRQAMCSILQPGYIADMIPEIAEELGIKPIKVYAVGSHDTASAIGAIPFEDEHTAFLSSGTWSLLGITLEKPILSEEARINEFTNEGGVDGKILFMRNITGLWLLQQLIAEWEREGDEPYSYDYLLNECQKVKSCNCIVDSDAPDFNHPASMKKAIQDYCRKTGQEIPETKGELVKCVLDSLAWKYDNVLTKLKQCTGKTIKKLFIVGGGSKNEVLNQLIANRLYLDVITGLTEATAVGNVIQQAIANNEIRNWEEGHKIVKASFQYKIYRPE